MRRAARLATASALAGTLMISMVAGQAAILSQSRTPAAQAQTPSPAPLTITIPRNADAGPVVAFPAGAAQVVAQLANGTAVTPAAPGLPAIGVQRVATTVTHTRPAGSAFIEPQWASATRRNTAPPGSAPITPQTIMAAQTLRRPLGAQGVENPIPGYPTPGYSAWYTGSFLVDTDSDGISEPIYFSLLDLQSDGGIDAIEVSIDDGTFGEGALSDLAAGPDDDEMFAAGTGPTTSETIRLGTYEFLVTFPNSIWLGSGPSASLQASTWLTGVFFVNVDASPPPASPPGYMFPALEPVSFVLSDTDSSGYFRTMDVSSDDATFGESAGGALGNLQTGTDDDERVSSGTTVRLGAFYSFRVAYNFSPDGIDTPASITAATWFTGSFVVDADSDGAADDAVNFVLTDPESNGVFATVDLSEDTEYGSGSSGLLWDDVVGPANDERGSIDYLSALRLGPYHAFTISFNSNPRGGADEARIGALTHFTGSFGFDVNGDGAVAGAGDTVYFDLFDTTSDGLYDTLGLFVGDAVLGSGTPGDGLLAAGNGEAIAGTATIGIGSTYAIQVSFAPNPANAPSDVTVLLATSGATPLAFQGSWTIDADGGEAANDRVYFLLQDTTSDGVVDTIEISLDPTYGQGSLGDGVVDAAGNDEQIGMASIPALVRLGVHPFRVSFTANILGGVNDASIASRWYTGTFSVDIDSDGTSEALDFVLIDPNSDGLFTVLEMDGDHNGVYAPAEVRNSSPASVPIGGSEGTVSFRANPTIAGSVTLTGPASSSNPGPAGLGTLPLQSPDSQQTASADPIAALVGPQGPEPPKVPIPGRALEPAPQRVTHDVSGQPVVMDEIVVRLDARLADPDRQIRQIAVATGASILGSISATRTYQLQYGVRNPDALDSFLRTIGVAPGVISAAHHYLVDLKVSRTPNDLQWADPDPNDPITDTWNLDYIRAPDAWDSTTGSRSIPVAVIDADLDGSHEDLARNVQSSWGTRTTRARGHGTHVAGTACAEGDNALGISGVAWECGLRLYDFGGVSAVRAQEAMVRAVDEGARIVNMSIQWIDNNRCGTPGTAATLKKTRETNAILAGAIDYAKRANRDVLWVFAAGNECRDAKYSSPASLVEEYPENVLVVGAIDHSGGLAPYSNYGVTVVVAAPGSEILSTLPEGEYGRMSGTSMATPHVTGLAVLVEAAHPWFTAAQVKECIMRGTKEPVPGNGFKTIDAPGAVECASVPNIRPSG